MPRSTRKGGRRAKQAHFACEGVPFRTFLIKHKRMPGATPEIAANTVRVLCGVIGKPLKSRAMLDSDHAAGQRWEKLWGEYQVWLRPPQ